MGNLFVFDIETIPDVDSGRKIYQLDNCSDDEVAQAMFARARAQSGRDFPPLHLHKIVAISAILATEQRIKVWSLGEIDADEKELITRFYKGLDQFTPTLISWNGGGFDLPVLHYRALLHGVSAPRYWEVGESDTSFRWNNYLSRYHYRHMDLMDILAGFQARANAPLTEIAVMLGFPGKMGMSGDAVWPAYQKGEIEKIRNYCETDVINTYLIYLKFELMRGTITEDAYLKSQIQLRENLIAEQKTHFNEFLDAWSLT